MQDGVIHPELSVLLQAGQRLGVVIAHVPKQSQAWAPVCALLQHREVEQVTPAIITATVVHYMRAHTHEYTKKREPILANSICLITSYDSYVSYHVKKIPKRTVPLN